MQGTEVGFEASFRRHLAREQRHAVLEILERELAPDVTLGEVIDAAQSLGWGDGMGALSLSELAEVLAGRQDMSDADADTASPDRAPPRRPTPTTTRTDPEIDALDEERMSTDRAAEVFVPIVEGLGKATMQELENETGIGRRKLRFHVGQLVRHGFLARHGMGRGTYYTIA